MSDRYQSHTSFSRILLGCFVCLLMAAGCEREVILPEDADTTPPLPPSGLLVERAEDGFIFIGWNMNTERDLAGYVLFRSEGDQLHFRPIDTLQDTYYIDLHLSYDTLYSYSVTAVDEARNASARSHIVTAQSPNNNPPKQPAGFEAYGQNGVSGHFMRLEWRPNTEADLAAYHLYRSASPLVTADAGSRIATIERSFFFDSTGIRLNTMYYYAITAVDRGGKESPLSLVAADRITEQPQLLSPPHLAAVQYKPLFKWRRVEGALRYKVVVGSAEAGEEVSSFTVDPTDAADLQAVYQGPSLAVGRMYYWRVATLTVSSTVPNALSEARAFQIVE